MGINAKIGAGISQGAWDGLLDTSSKLLADLDSPQNTKLVGIEAGADVNVGEEYTTAEQTKVGNIEFAASEMLQMEKLATPPSSPATGDMYFDTGVSVYKYYNGASWDTVKFVVEAI